MKDACAGFVFVGDRQPVCDNPGFNASAGEFETVRFRLPAIGRRFLSVTLFGFGFLFIAHGEVTAGY